MFETFKKGSTRPEDRTVTIFLNRDCPRTCPQCAIADHSRRPMSLEDWKQALDNLNKVLGTTFFLFLGVEPLVLGETFLDLIRFMRGRRYTSANYTTSPEPLFSKWRQPLVDVGIENWSSGIDSLPHLGSIDDQTDRKIRESLVGLQWMADHGVSTHVTTTIHKKNLKHIPEIMEWCYEHITGVEYAVNFLHWAKPGETGWDFSSPPDSMRDLLWDGSDKERAEVEAVMREVHRISQAHPGRMYTYDDYLLHAHNHYDKLDVHCAGMIGPSVDADGTMRLCGYNTGDPRGVGGFSVRELSIAKSAEVFQRVWTQEMEACSGCLWACFQLPPGAWDRPGIHKPQYGQPLMKKLTPIWKGKMT